MSEDKVKELSVRDLRSAILYAAIVRAEACSDVERFYELCAQACIEGFAPRDSYLGRKLVDLGLLK